MILFGHNKEQVFITYLDAYLQIMVFRIWNFLLTMVIIAFAGDRLRNFEIRVGNDGQDIGSNAVCFKQLEPMEPGVAKNFTCSSAILGCWISVNKSTYRKIPEANMGPTWVLSAPDGPHIGPMDLVIRDPIAVLQRLLRNFKVIGNFIHFKTVRNLTIRRVMRYWNCRLWSL